MKQIFLILFLAISSIAIGQEKKVETETTLKVKGKSVIYVRPDAGILVLQIKKVDKEFSQTIVGLNSKTNDIFKQLNSIGFKDNEIKTTQFEINENRIYLRDSYVDSGYVATQNVQVEFKNERETISNILTAFSKNQPDINLSFNFKLSDTLKSKTQEDIIKLAVQDAKGKAKIIAVSAGITLKKMTEISYGIVHFENNGLVASGHAMTSTSREDITGFNAQDIMFTDTVTITWEFE
ncbi:MAG: SIMPL domain-containing protein [Bacteroidia bacterium]